MDKYNQQTGGGAPFKRGPALVRAEGFTLIELLIVIAVIGLLSSIVLVNVTSSRESARIAAGLQLGSSLKHSLGAYLVGEWSFDNNDARDDSGNGNNGTVNGATPVDGIIGRAMQFDGVDDYVDVPNNPSFNMTSAISIETWVSRDSSETVQWDFITKSSHLLFRLRHTPYLHPEIWLQLTSGYQRVWMGGDAISFDEWHHIAFSYDGTWTRVYVDGQSIGESNVFTGSIVPSSSSLRMMNGMNGEIDEVRIYSTALTSAEIQQHYVEGLDIHKNMVKK